MYLFRFVLFSHCVSQWGVTFRPNFLKLGTIRQACLEIPILATTATATREMRLDITKTLQLKNPYNVLTSTNRENLKFFVFPKSKSYEDDLLPWVIFEKSYSSFYTMCTYNMFFI